MPSNTFYADSMAFLAFQGQPPIFDSAHRPQLSLAHVTSVPPIPAMLDCDAALAAHIKFTQEVLSNADTYLIRSRKNLDSRSGLGVLLGMQHAPHGLTFNRVQDLFDCGVRVMSLVYGGKSDYGSGSGVEGGLTDQGKQLILWMTVNELILDLSHANSQTANESLDFILRQKLAISVMASHSGISSVHPHPRNLDDEVPRKIFLLDGYIGVPAMNFMLGETTMRMHINHIISWCDENCVGIGSDCPHVDITMEQAREQYDRMVAMLKGNIPQGVSFPDRAPRLIEHGGSLFKQLRKTMADVPDAVFGQNFKNFLIRSLPR